MIKKMIRTYNAEMQAGEVFEHVSPQLMNFAKMNFDAAADDYCIKAAYDQASAFKKLVEAISAIGWVEHTADWDLQLVFELQNGDILFGAIGHEEFEIGYEGWEREEGTSFHEFKNADHVAEVLAEVEADNNPDEDCPNALEAEDLIIRYVSEENEEGEVEYGYIPFTKIKIIDLVAD